MIPEDSYVLYDLFTWFFEIVFNVFFRTIRVRGSYRVPTEGPMILVGAPHANQFVDPVLLGVAANSLCGRRPSFLIAQSSYEHPVIGRLSRAMKAIPVGRAQDTFKVATGEVYSDGKDPLTILGKKTKFLTEAVGKNFSLQGSNDMAPVQEVISDTELKLAREFRTDECKAMMASGFSPKGFKLGTKVDNSKMFHSVFNHLAKGRSLGIFPEGGSHDRPEMLPLKPGVAIMALGAAVKHPGLKVAIVPVGMNYFHPHKFRSRAVLEFGEPLYVDSEMVKEYQSSPEAKTESVTKLMSRIVDALQLVTINCPDYETLMVLQASQRLYKPSRHIPLSLTIEVTRRLVQGFLKYRDKDPRVQTLFNDVRAYNKQLISMGISDHQVPVVRKTKWHVLLRLIHHVLYLMILSVASLPGIILGSPILITTKLYSKRQARIALAGSNVKIAARDVISTWKILISLLMVPTVYGIYSFLTCWFVFFKTNWLGGYTLKNFIGLFLFCFWGLLLLGYATIIIGEAGLDIARSIKPLYLSLSPVHKDGLERIRTERELLRVKITDLVNELGPQVFPDIADRLDKFDEVVDVHDDPRIDINGLTNSLDGKGDYDLAKVPVFSAESAPATLPAGPQQRKKNKKSMDDKSKSNDKQESNSDSIPSEVSNEVHDRKDI